MKYLAIIMAGAAAAIPVPAHAITVLASNVDFSAAPFTFGVTATDQFTFTFASREQFDFSPVLVRTSGNAAVTTVFGAPSVAFTDPPTTFGPNSFPGFSSVPTDGRPGATATPSDLGLRYGEAGAYYYGYARFTGSTLTRVAFEDRVNTAIRAGAVPEPATWAMMVMGFGMLGGAMRYRRRSTRTVYA